MIRSDMLLPRINFKTAYKSKTIYSMCVADIHALDLCWCHGGCFVVSKTLCNLKKETGVLMKLLKCEMNVVD